MKSSDDKRKWCLDVVSGTPLEAWGELDEGVGRRLALAHTDTLATADVYCLAAIFDSEGCLF